MIVSDVTTDATYVTTIAVTRSTSPDATVSRLDSTRATGVRHAVGSNPRSRHGPPIACSPSSLQDLSECRPSLTLIRDTIVMSGAGDELHAALAGEKRKVSRRARSVTPCAVPRAAPMWPSMPPERSARSRCAGRLGEPVPFSCGAELRPARRTQGDGQAGPGRPGPPPRPAAATPGARWHRRPDRTRRTPRPGSRSPSPRS